MSMDPRDETLDALYRGAAIELPRAEADAAVLRMARQAVADAPSRPTRWSPRLALAATVVLAVGLVTRVQLEAPDLQPSTAPAKATPAAGVEPAATIPETAPKANAGAADAPPAAVVAQASRQPQTGGDIASPASPAVSKLREQAGTQERQDTGGAAAKKNALALEKAEIARAQPTASGTVGAVTESASRRDNRSRDESELKKDREPAGDRRTQARSETGSAESVQADTSAPVATPFPGASATLPAVSATPPPHAARPAAAPSAPSARMQASPRELERRALNDEIPETMLTPEQWAARIATLRKSGRHAEADASLKRLTEKFPGFKVPAEARSPNIE